MKKKSIKILFLLLTLALLIGVLPGMSAFAEPQTWPSGDTTVTYNDDDSPVTLTVSGTGAMADYTSIVQVPWRNKRSSIQSVVIKDGVTSIGAYAFYNSSQMTSVSIPGSVTSIGQDAFYLCTSLTSVVIPNGVTSIGEDAFLGCSSLSSIAIPSGVTSIGTNAFRGCSEVTSVTIGSGVTSIGMNAFKDCSKVTSVTISSSVTNIGETAFAGVHFTSVTFEPGENGAPLTIGDHAFDYGSLAYGSGNAKLYYENGDEVAAGTKMNTLGKKTLTWKSSGFTMTFQRGRGTGDDQQLPATAGADYQLPDGNNMFTAPEGEVFDCWKDTDTGVTYKAMATIPNVSKNYTLEAQWKPASQDSGTRTGGGLSTNGADLVFNIPGADGGWEYIGGGVPQRAYRLNFAPMQGGSAYFMLTSGENGETMNVYPQTTVRVVATPDSGYRVASIVWSMIDGSASYDITESQTFVMPAMDAVVYVTFQPVA